MENLKVKDKLKLLPDLPGVYLMFDASNTIIYIGKAKNLKNRVKSYFVKNHDILKVRVMVPQIDHFDFIITDSEMEALILESQLIKRHKPKYNVLLKDDKQFPWFFITEEDYPRILIVRRNKTLPAKGKFFGPYTNSRAMYSTLEHIKKLFPLKQCKQPKFKDRACIYHQIGKCSAPCQKLISPEDYKEIVHKVEMFLTGNQEELIKTLKTQMEFYAEKQQYEKAARLRDSFQDIERTVERQKVVTDNLTVSQDIIGFCFESLKAAVSLLQIRNGRLIEKKDFEIELNEVDTKEEITLSFIKNYYSMIEPMSLPKEIIFRENIDKKEKELIEIWLKYKKGNKVTLTSPKTGKKLELVNLADKNANSHMEEMNLKSLKEIEADWNEVGSYIKEKLSLNNFPNVIECFDISHIQGTNTVAGMVVFKNGKKSKKDYKKFKIRSSEGEPNDFESMREVIKRRYSHLQKNNLPMPDLIIIDGGKGQLSSATSILDELNIKVDIVSLAERLEEVFIPNKKTPVIFPTSSSALFLFQQVRDETHRFAISFHRQLREKSATKSLLDDIPKIGKERKKILLENFKTVENVLKAKKKELQNLFGMKTGAEIYYNLKAKK